MKLRNPNYPQKVGVLTLAIGLSAVLFLGLSWNTIRIILLDNAEREIRSVLNFAVSHSEFYIKQYNDGILTKEEAENKVVELLSNMQYEESYIWANDNNAIARVHLRPEKIGVFQKSYLRHTNALKTTDMYFEFSTNLKPFVESKVMKVNGIVLLPEWNWVLGYGVYLDEVDKTMWQYMKTISITSITSLGLIWLLCLYLLRPKQPDTR